MASLNHHRIDPTEVWRLAEESRAIATAADSELAWNEPLRRTVAQRCRRLPSGELEPVTMLSPNEAPRVLRDAVDFWRRLPERVDQLIDGRWPRPDEMDVATSSRLALLARRCDSDNGRRREWLDVMITGEGDIHAYAIALLRDRTQWIETGDQLYGTMSVWSSAGSRPRVPIADAARLSQRRAELGLPPIGEDAARHITELALVRRLGCYAGFGASTRAA